MIGFPDLDTLCLALKNGAVPPTISRAPASATRDEEGWLWLRPSVPLPRVVQVGLKAIGLRIEADGGPLAERLSCWHELIPLRRGPELGPAGAVRVLFEFPDVRQLPRMANEIRRLGRGQLQFRWPVDDGAVLLHVDGPPYSAVLRATEEDGSTLAPRAYREAAPRVWIQAGFAHPLIEQIEPPAGKLLLLRSPRGWTYLDDRPFLREAEEFALADGAVRWRVAGAGRRVPVRLRHTKGGPGGDAELWVLRDRPIEKLEALVHGAADDVLSQLAFAVGERDGQRYVLLRVRGGGRSRSVGKPPVLVLDAVGFRSHLKLPNLFLPCGRRLSPALRRDAVRGLLAGDPDLVTWLWPHADGSFTPEGLPSGAFRPLEEHVHYSVEQPAQALRPWLQSPLLELESFALRDGEETARLKRSPEEEAVIALRAPESAPAEAARWWDRITGWFRTATVRRPEPPTAVEPAPAEAPLIPVEEAVHVFLQPEEQRTPPAEPPPAEPDNLHEWLQSLEDRLLHDDNSSDETERRTLWAELAGLYQSAGRLEDAALCWTNALWEADRPSPVALVGWLRVEGRRAGHDLMGGGLDALLAVPRPEAADARALAAFVAWVAGACASDDAAAIVRHRAAVVRHGGQVQQFLERYESALPVRAAWLGWAGLARLSDGDALLLTRARDRLLERLHREGLRLEPDEPGFVRFVGQDSRERYRTVRDWLAGLPERAHEWIDRLYAHRPPEPETRAAHVLVTERYLGKLHEGGLDDARRFTQAYADLAFAWGLARLGEGHRCAELLRRSETMLARHDEVHRILLDAYAHRIRQAADARANAGPLPAELLVKLDGLGPVERYKVDWLRRQSRILEPDERIDPYRGDVQIGFYDGLNRALAGLAELRDRDELAERVNRLLQESVKDGASPVAHARVLAVALELSPRIGEKFAREMLGRVVPVLDDRPRAPQGTDDAARVRLDAELLERALRVAGHFGLAEHVQAFAGRFRHLLDARRTAGAARAFEVLAGQCFRGLRRLGLRSEIDPLLRQMAEWALQGRDLAALRRRSQATRAAALRTLLVVADGWFDAGREADATAVLDEARSLLFDGRLDPAEQTELARAYAAALGQAPVGLALPRLEELLDRLERVYDRLSTNTHYSLAQLGVIEAAVLAVVSEDFTLGRRVRRWLDDDEYRVRRRIHGDVRRVMEELP
jgi:hypothetical protein